MGKRELLIVLVFAVLGIGAWRLTAPPPQDGARPLSLDTVAEIWRNRNPADSRGRASVTTTGIVAAPAAMLELRVANVFAVEVTGADRPDIAWTLTAEATGRTDDQARARVEESRLQVDDMGSVLAFSVRAPPDTPRAGTLTLSVPSRLAIRIESARQARVRAVAGVRLENLVGDVELRDIHGTVEGSHRSGTLTIDGSADVTLSLVGSNTTVRRARGPINVTARSGATTIEAPGGDVDVEATGHDLVVVQPARRVRTSVVGGSVSIVQPRGAIDVDARRASVDVSLDRTVPGTIFVAEGQLRLGIASPQAVGFDVSADEGRIDAAAVALPVVSERGRATVRNLVDDAVRLAVRGDRSGIVIVPSK